MPGSLLTLLILVPDVHRWVPHPGDRTLCLHWRAMLNRSDPCGVKLGDENGNNSKITGVPTNLKVPTDSSWKELSFGAC